MKNISTFFILFIIIIIGFFGFWFYKDRIFSKEILKLEILGQENAKMGQEVEYTVKYKNNGNFVLQKPRLIFELPDNSLTEDSKVRFSQDLKDIYPGDEDFVKFKGRLLGKDNDLKVAKAWLSYTPKNLTARYESDTTFTTKIEKVDINLDFDLSGKAEKGKEILYSLNYFSNVDYPLENLSVKIDGVDGFSFSKSDPVSLDGSEWKIPTLTKTQGGRIKITGVVSADPGRKIEFKARLGMWQDGRFITIKESTKEVQIIEPQIFISQHINGSLNYTASPGEKLHYEVFFRNISSTPFENLLLIIKFNGSAFDLSSLQSLGGDARPYDGLIAFDYKQISALKYLGPQKEGKVEFDIKLKDSWQAGTENVIKNIVQISEISQEFVAKINSKLEVSQKVFYSGQSGIYNIGPVPPIAGQTTTYIVTWQIKNYFNDAKNVKVKVVLPQNITITGKFFPEDEISKFTIDNASRELVWSVGDVLAGTGINTASPIVSFQISLSPTSLQQGSVADLIGQATITGEDQITGLTIKNTSPGVSADLPDDPGYSGKGTVQ